MTDSIVQTTDPATMTNDAIIEEWDSYPSGFPDMDSYRLVTNRKRALADEYNARPTAGENFQQGSRTKRYLNV